MEKSRKFVPKQQQKQPIASKSKPKQQQEQPKSLYKPKQYLVVLRHSERLDDQHRVSDEERASTKVMHELDIPISQNGHKLAYQTGQVLRGKVGLKVEEIKTKWNVKVYSSPYLRCLQTSDQVIKGLTDEKENIDIVVREQLSELQIGGYNHMMKIDDLTINQTNPHEEFLKQYLTPSTVINYNRDYQNGVYEMKYPEEFKTHYDRYLNFFKLTLKEDFTEAAKIKKQKTEPKNELVILVTHANAVVVFYELKVPNARMTKFIIGVGYCCMSIYERSPAESDNWNLTLFGDNTHLERGEPSEIMDEVNEYLIESSVESKIDLQSSAGGFAANSPLSTHVGSSLNIGGINSIRLINEIAENYANRQREGPCGLAMKQNQEPQVEEVAENNYMNIRNQQLSPSFIQRAGPGRVQSQSTLRLGETTTRNADSEFLELSQKKFLGMLGGQVRKSVQGLGDGTLIQVTRNSLFLGSNNNDGMASSVPHSHGDSGMGNIPIENLKIFQLFKVPMVKLKLLTSIDNKIEFLIEHMTNNIRDQLRTISQMELERQQNIKIFKKQMKDQFNDEHFQGLYSWLKINSPGHEGLIKKLRTKLIESLQSEDIDKRPRSARFNPKIRQSSHLQKVIVDNPGNLLISGSVLNEAIEKTFNAFARSSLNRIESQPNLRRSLVGKDKILENDYKSNEGIKTFKNLNAMMKDLDQESKQKKRKSARPMTAVAKHEDEEGEGNHNQQLTNKLKNDALTKFFDTLPAQSWDDIREKEKRQQMDQLLKQFSMEQKSAYDKSKVNWDQKLEKIFSKHKSEIRLGLTKYSSTGPWNKVVLGQMDQLRQDMPKTTSQKDLQRAYNNLRYDKVQEIVNTIPSLNECLDKRLFQKSVNCLPKDEMNKIETQIAEDILWTYTRKKYNYQTARGKFFKEKIRTSADKIKINDDKMEDKRLSVTRKKEYRKLSKRYRTILGGLQNGNISLKQNKNDPLLKLYHQGVHNFKEPLPLHMNSQKDQNDFVSLRMALDQFSSANGRVQVAPKYDQKVPHKYFIEKYAGGPGSNLENRKQVNGQDIMKAAIRIQSMARVVIARKIARDKKNELERQKFLYEENLKRQQQKLEKDMLYRQHSVAVDETQPIYINFTASSNLNTFQTSQSPSPQSRVHNKSKSSSIKKSKMDTRYLIENNVFQSSGQNQKQPLFQQSNMSNNFSIIPGDPNYQKGFNQNTIKDSYQPSLDLKEKTYKTPGQLKKNMQMVIQNLFQACKKNNFNYIEKNRDRLTLKVLSNSKDHKGNTPIYVAVANKHIDTVSYLIERGVTVNSKNENGNIPLHRAFMNQDYDMIGLLQSKGANFDMLNDLHQTPLYFGSRVLIDKLGISSKPANFILRNDFQLEKVQGMVKRVTQIFNETPGKFIEKKEDKDKVIQGVLQRLESPEVIREFAPLYNSPKKI
ncbi:iq calmodulin-binding motif family protein [Stylonychia lemnae]|uniref:Iq calmodulin-binding motif family protein n=1 Tax=Stylonychia lemnae TaxID=5949 RepID=A0A078B1N2_STYLE|nr:iq calmodulin-binding motif family protein [Stylonychia lemnae]|eukprot:CDW87232.1 iq calmodulin-binding motif family protein [Stylonychia lemnae]